MRGFVVGQLVYWIEPLVSHHDDPQLVTTTIKQVSDVSLTVDGHGPSYRKRFAMRDGVPCFGNLSRLGSTQLLFGTAREAMSAYRRYLGDQVVAAHRKVAGQGRDEFCADVRTSLDVLSDLTGVRVAG